MTTSIAPVWEGKLFSAGWQTGSGEPVTVTAPGSGRHIGTIATATPEDLDTAVASAKEAQKAWAAAPYSVRAAVMLKAATLLEANPARLMDALVSEAGSAQGKAGFEVGLVASELKECAALASHPYGELLRSGKPRMSMARRVPMGVVGVISPFNFPGILSMRSVAPALALGNAVILKPDPRTSISGGLALAELLAEAGLADGVLHVLPGGGELGAALVAHDGVSCISFTGSTAAGRKVAEAAAPLLKRVHLELGGNNALPGCRRGGRGGRGRLGFVPAPGADLHDHRAAFGAPVDRGGVHLGARQEGRQRARRGPDRADERTGADHR